MKKLLITIACNFVNSVVMGAGIMIGVYIVTKIL